MVFRGVEWNRWFLLLFASSYVHGVGGVGDTYGMLISILVFVFNGTWSL